MNYTISIIRNNYIARLNYSDKEEALKKYETLYNARYHDSNIDGVQLWECRQGLTIDNDPRAKIIRQYYI